MERLKLIRAELRAGDIITCRVNEIAAVGVMLDDFSVQEGHSIELLNASLPHFTLIKTWR
jgi:hypothetical protein